MNYLMGLWISLHKRGIQAILLAGCLLGFGLGQTLGASYGRLADYGHRMPTGKIGTTAAASRAGSSLGNNVAGQQGVSVTRTAVLAQQAATQTPSGKGHQANTDGKGKGHGGKKPPKTKGHRMENDGGPHGKQSKDGGDKGHDTSGNNGGGQ